MVRKVGLKMDDHNPPPNLSLRPPPKKKVVSPGHPLSMGLFPQNMARTRETQIQRLPWTGKRRPSPPNLKPVPKTGPLPPPLQIPLQPRYGDNKLLSPLPPKILAPEIRGPTHTIPQEPKKPIRPNPSIHDRSKEATHQNEPITKNPHRKPIETLGDKTEIQAKTDQAEKKDGGKIVGQEKPPCGRDKRQRFAAEGTYTALPGAREFFKTGAQKAARGRNSLNLAVI